MKRSTQLRAIKRWTVLFTLGLSTLACALPISNTTSSGAKVDLTKTSIYESVLLTVTNSMVETSTPVPTIVTEAVTAEPTQLPTVIPGNDNRTPPALPADFTTTYLNPNDTAVSYIKDTCQYLRQRWDVNNSEPGTIVMAIMYHSITDKDPWLDNQINIETFQTQMESLKEQGFETVTSEQLANFLEFNAKIPKRSVILIADDRSPCREKEFFMPYMEKFGWTETIGWIIGAGDDSTDKKPATACKSEPNESYDSLWQQMETYDKTGLLDIQAHGYVHNENISEGSKDDFIRQELYKSSSILEEHFGKKPITYIWPGGGFTKRGAEIAREAGYRLGFTINPRGPIMYNWIPQALENDKTRPSYLAEGSTGDPLLTLPRYWDTDALNYIDVVRSISKDASSAAEETKATELEYYDIVCKPTLGSIPGYE